MTLLQVKDLHTHFITRDNDNRIRVAKALNAVSFTLNEGEIFGLVGETGAGKSLTAYSVIGLLRPPARIVQGSITFAGRNLLELSQKQLNQLRGTKMSMVVQSPRASLDPLMRVGQQIVRALRAHSDIPPDAAWRRAIEAMENVGIPDAEQRALSWPHELSGGMAQRVLIAMALINRPRLLIADEPTTGLDVTVQAQILELIRELVRAMNMAALIITHDLGIVAHYCERFAVMYAGRIVETGSVGAVFENPRHPYTRALIASTPENLELDGDVVFGGAPPNLYALPAGCYYADRCPLAREVCGTMPPTVDLGSGHEVVCHFVAADEETRASWTA